METAWPTVNRPSRDQLDHVTAKPGRFLTKKINSEKDVIYFRTKSAAYRDTLAYVDQLCEKIRGTGSKILNHKYTIKSEMFQKCSQLLDELAVMCDNTDLSQAKGSAPLRFGHVAFRDWFDATKVKCREFIYTQLASEQDEQLKEELSTYLTESFGNRMRIDYGTGHELSFLLFTMGLSCLSESSSDTFSRPNTDKAEHKPDSIETTTATTTTSKAIQHPNMVTLDRLRTFVGYHGWDILALFSHKYLRLCRQVQVKFRLEPAGSRGVYNMDDFQYLPFLFGAAQLVGIKYISTKDFYLQDNVDMYKSDFIFLEAVDFILNNKRGPFHEHSYTLWCLMDLGTWENIYRRIRMKFTDDVLSPFPIVQHLLFGNYILRWDSGDDDETTITTDERANCDRCIGPVGDDKFHAPKS
uniref:Serine/threonine-protein phosphatase 2A activator n=1 Tax=Aceria tosichella TaxID=561515 RepID=A0A6G1S3P7_9ACAR